MTIPGASAVRSGGDERGWLGGHGGYGWNGRRFGQREGTVMIVRGGDGLWVEETAMEAGGDGSRSWFGSGPVWVSG